MWSADRLNMTRYVPGLLALIAAVLLTGCQVRPLYGDASAAGSGAAGGSAVREALGQIEVAEPRDRKEQIFRNALLFNLRGGNGDAETLYRLTYRMQVREQQIAIEKITGTPSSYQVQGQLSYLLEDAATGEVLMTDRVSAIASYDRSSQDFANVRASLDGEKRVGNELARLVEIRLSSYFASR